MENRFFDLTMTKEKAWSKVKPSSLFESKYLLAHYQKLDRLEKELQRLPGKEEFFFLQTQKQFNAFTFIPFVLKFEPIQHLYVATYTIARRVIDALIELVDKGMIENITMNISDSLLKRNPKTVDLLTAQIRSRSNIKVLFSWNHAKVSLMKTANNYFVIEGSGNWNENARYEQYTFANSKGLFDFRKELFQNIELKHIADCEGLKTVQQ